MHNVYVDRTKQCYTPLLKIKMQHPIISFDALSPNSASTKSLNLMDLYCNRCLKSMRDALKICLVMYGRSTGNPSDDIRNAHGEEVPSFDVCLS